MLAHATVIPLVYEEALHAIQELHPVVRAVCLLYFKHLRHSWFSLENPVLEDMYGELCKCDLLHRKV